jgi:hypothetical protein
VADGLVVKRGINFPSPSGIVDARGRRAEVRYEPGSRVRAEDFPRGTDIDALIAKGVLERPSAGEIITAPAEADAPRARKKKGEPEPETAAEPTA